MVGRYQRDLELDLEGTCYYRHVLGNQLWLLLLEFRPADVVPAEIQISPWGSSWNLDQLRWIQLEPTPFDMFTVGIQTS